MPVVKYTEPDFCDTDATRDCHYTKEIKMRILMAKDGLSRKISLLTSKLNIKLWKKLVKYYVWSIALYGSEPWTSRKLE